jgi:hypothetical protein
MISEFCNNCGSQIIGSGTNPFGAKNVMVGSVDDPSFVRLAVNLYTAHALKCSYTDDELNNSGH